jgi:hypothetical protein
MVTMVNIYTRRAKGDVVSHGASAGKGYSMAIYIPIRGEFNIELADASPGYAPQILSTKRVGNNLVLAFV